jgi:hypothetical protein
MSRKNLRSALDVGRLGRDGKRASRRRNVTAVTGKRVSSASSPLPELAVSFGDNRPVQNKAKLSRPTVAVHRFLSFTMLHVLFFALSGTSAISIPRGDQNVFAPLPKPADLPVSNPTYSFWTDSPGANPMATEGSTGALTGEADVCIIGSGITGVSAAYHLATAVQRGAIPVPHGQSELRAVVLEARDFCKPRLILLPSCF